MFQVPGRPGAGHQPGGGGRGHRVPAVATRPGALEWILDTIGGPPSELVRIDDRFRELGLDPERFRDREAVITLLLAHPELMQRPVVIRGERGLIARPSERVLELVDEADGR